ncbi:phage portal protein [Micromonospora humida]|uniref:phage portal protein n=1 Tax=Micromonospora humida TaxID=2809018 RepID=UPI00366B145E
MTNLLRAATRRLSVRHDELHGFQGNQYWGAPLSSWTPNQEGIGSDFVNLVSQAYKANAIVFACELTRIALFSEARFQWRQLRNGRPGDLFGTQDLAVLERPWPGGTTGDLLGRMLQDADFGGSAFVARPAERQDRLMRLRPDWVTIVLGSDAAPDEAGFAMDADFLGVIYHPGGQGSGRPTVALLADEVAHFAPNPDPLAAYRGVSWLAPILSEIQADRAATDHKLAFFHNGATPQLVVTLGAEVNQTAFSNFVAKLESGHRGVSNAYRTLVLGGGANVNVVGKDLAQLDFKATQGAGETRIAAASGVHPVVAALSEGMAGSSLNAGNFNAAKRLVADRTLRPLWRGACAALSSIVPAPDGAELWFDERDISFLQEDRKDAADIEFVKAQTVRQLIEAGFEPRSVVAAVEAEDMNLLRHTGMTSVQLQPPGAGQPTPAGESPLPARSAPGDPLKRYWTKGEGLSKWVSSPHPWTTLRDHLAKHVGVHDADQIASEWFHEVFGIWPGERKGKNPAGRG